MRRFSEEQILSAPPEVVETVVVDEGFGHLLADALSPIEVEPLRYKDGGETVERTLRITPPAPTFGRLMPTFSDWGWHEETIYTRPAHRLEYVVVPREGRLGAAMINKGVISFEPAENGRTLARLEAQILVRLPGLAGPFEARMETGILRRFGRWVQAVESGLASR